MNIIMIHTKAYNFPCFTIYNYVEHKNVIFVLPSLASDERKGKRMESEDVNSPELLHGDKFNCRK